MGYSPQDPKESYTTDTTRVLNLSGPRVHRGVMEGKGK